MKGPKRIVNLSLLSFYTKETSYQIFQIVKSYLLKLYIKPKKTEFGLEDVFSLYFNCVFSPPGRISLGLQKKLNRSLRRFKKLQSGGNKNEKNQEK